MSEAENEHDYFQLTSDFVQHTGKNIFLTGKAGTGKTTFLKHIKEHRSKNLIVIAPTGVAAINAGGVTMHSFFQLPLGCFIPGSFRSQFQSRHPVTDRHHLLQNLRYSNEKIELVRNLELLIIDEVSMLRCDWLDAIDNILRSVRRNQQEVFGGVQLLLIGDLYQLPPVVNEGEWQMLHDYYESPFFFSAQALKQAQPLCIELKKVYRQSDEEFIHLLNRVRNNEVRTSDLERLHQLYQPHFKAKPEDHFITLTTHNRKADEINGYELRRLSGKEFISKATLSGEFPERVFPAEESLLLKEEAQIMFLKNDVKEKKYFNGKIGVISEIGSKDGRDVIKVRFPDKDETITVEKETWRNLRYSFSESENKINEEELGAFTQYPIRLAWAVTIHKSQGLTFEKAIIDAGAAFAAGQVYVALSRCVSLEGMVLLSRISTDVINTDEAIVAYMKRQQSIRELEPILAEEKKIHTIKTTLSLFNLQPLLERIKSFIEYMGARKLEEKEKIIRSLYSVQEALLPLQVLAQKFQDQVKQMTASGLSENTSLQLSERVLKAKKYFAKEMDEKVLQPLLQINKDLQQLNKVRKVLKAMKGLIDTFEHFALHYSSDEKKQGAEKILAKTIEDEEAEVSDVASENLFNLLKQIRRQSALEENLPPYRICNDATLKEIVTYLPQTLNEMASIRGMGDYTLHKYGELFLESVKAYCRIHNLSGKMHLKSEAARVHKKKFTSGTNNSSPDVLQKKEPNSQTQSFQLFQSGKSISEIAVIRSFSEGTIAAHLSHFIKTGDIDVYRLISEEKFQLIQNALQTATAPGLSAVKNILSDDISYSEIRFVIAALERERGTVS